MGRSRDDERKDGHGHEPSPSAWIEDQRDAGRRLFAEWLGTLLLVLAGAGAPMVDAVTGHVSPAAQAVAPGLVVMAVIYFMGAVSGAHINPAVTVGFALRGHFPWRRVPGYVAAQLAGAVCAVLFLRSTVGNVAALGATVPHHVTTLTALVLEGALTLGLVSVVLGTASGARNIGTNAALAIGAYVALAGLWAAPLTGASMNPARSFGPAVVGMHWHGFVAYAVGPLAGAVVAVGFAWILRGGPSRAADEAAQGELDQPS